MSWRRRNSLARRGGEGRTQRFVDFIDKLDPDTIQRVADEMAERIRKGGRATANGLRRWQRRRR